MRAVSCLVGQQRQKGTNRLKGDQLFDIICVGIFMVTVLFLRHLNAGAIYFWIKDLTQEFLKLQVIYTAVELFDKVILHSISQRCNQAVVNFGRRICWVWANSCGCFTACHQHWFTSPYEGKPLASLC